VAKAYQRRLHAIAQAIARRNSLALAGVTPAFESAVRWRRAGRAKATCVDDQPQCSKVSKCFALEDAAQVRLDIGWARQACVVAHKAKARAIRAQAPRRSVIRVELILEGGRCRSPPAVDGQMLAGAIEVVRG